LNVCASIALGSAAVGPILLLLALLSSPPLIGEEEEEEEEADATTEISLPLLSVWIILKRDDDEIDEFEEVEQVEEALVLRRRR
jgi:hypothetical protein